METKPVVSAPVETAKPAPTPAPAKPAIVATAETKAPDDLTAIKGIGPAVQSKLRALGIQTYDDLAKADPDRLIDQLKGSQPISPARVRGWTEAAASTTRPAAS
ncbi:MAG: helix-hairpin-helix domain-containing protein [Pseudomonadota bacterium]